MARDHLLQRFSYLVARHLSTRCYARIEGDVEAMYDLSTPGTNIPLIALLCSLSIQPVLHSPQRRAGGASCDDSRIPLFLYTRERSARSRSLNGKENEPTGHQFHSRPVNVFLGLEAFSVMRRGLGHDSYRTRFPNFVSLGKASGGLKGQRVALLSGYEERGE